jgi:hypothetical protein
LDRRLTRAGVGCAASLAKRRGFNRDVFFVTGTFLVRAACLEFGSSVIRLLLLRELSLGSGTSVVSAGGPKSAPLDVRVRKGTLVSGRLPYNRSASAEY